MTPCPLGVSATSYLSVWQTIDTLDFLQCCHRMRAAGIQAVLNCDPATLRAHLDKHEMYFEAMVPLPLLNDTTSFEQALKNAKAAGATALRGACLGTRRYETFTTLAAWQQHVSEIHKSLSAALPLLEKYQIPLGLENHKDWTADELTALLKSYSSEYLGVCLDFGNNISLLDLPMEAIEKLASYTVCTHVKDIAVGAYSEGILLSETILGQGVIDLPRAVALIRSARPQTRMTLEMITREPLKIPLLKESYWATLPGKSAADLARVLNFVNRQPPPSLPPAAEDQNIIDCLSAWPAIVPADLPQI